MATVRDIARLLADRHGMTPAMAADFLQNMVEVIHEGLLQDRMVKVKGFGTFKLQEVRERASVNVNTGERVVIASHDRITFTPDAVMRDMVNRPFAHFETVITGDDGILAVHEGETAETVVPADEDVAENKAAVENTVSPPAGEEETAAAAMPADGDVAENRAAVENTVSPPAGEEETAAAVPADEDGAVNRAAVERPSSDSEAEGLGGATEPDGIAVAPEGSDGASEKPSRKLSLIVIGVISAVILCLICYLASNRDSGQDAPRMPVPAKSRQAEEYSPLQTVPAKPRQEHAQTQPDTQATEQKKDEVDLAKYNKDARVRYGAYYIVGTDTVVTVHRGQTLRGISKAYLGPDMECYVEAYNETREVNVGDRVRIPKLKVKKRMKKK